MKLQTTLCVLFLSGLLIGASARDLMRSERFTNNDGMPSNRVTNICEDAEGHIWFSTWNGLCCWNGTKLESYTESQDGTSFGRIYRIQALRDGTFLFYNDADEAFCFDPNTRTLLPQSNALPIEVERDGVLVSDIQEDSYGLAIKRNGITYHLPYSEGMRQEKQLHTFYEDSRGEIWMDFQNNLYHIWFEPSPFFYFYSWPIGNTVPFQSTVRSLYVTSDDKLLVASRNYRLYGLTDTVMQVPYPGNVYEIQEDNSHRLWLGLRKKGLYYWSESEGIQPAMPNLEQMGLTDVFALLKLRKQEKLWVGTWGQGIHLVDIHGDEPVLTSTLCNDSLKNIHMMLQLQNGMVGACTMTGFHLFSQSGDYLLSVANQCNVLCAIEMNDGRVLFATMAQGLFWMNLNGSYEPAKEIDCKERIVALEKDRLGRLWMVAENRLYCYSPETKQVDVLDDKDFGTEITFSEATITTYQDSLLYVGAASGLLEVNLNQIDSYLTSRRKQVEQERLESILFYTMIGIGLFIMIGLIVWIIWHGFQRQAKMQQLMASVEQPNSEEPLPVVENTPQEDELFRQKVNRIMDSAIGNPDVDIMMLSKMMEMPKNAFYYRCNEVFKTSPAALLQNRRIERAQELLDQGTLSVREVAFQVGFNDPKYFSKVFKAKVGRSPSQTRKDTDGSSSVDAEEAK